MSRKLMDGLNRGEAIVIFVAFLVIAAGFLIINEICKKSAAQTTTQPTTASAK